MNIKITVACWIQNKPSAHEVVEIDENQLLDILRGEQPAVFKTPIADQYHWELLEVLIS